MMLDNKINSKYKGFIKSNLMSSLSNLTFTDKGIIQIANLCQSQIGSYFDRNLSRDYLVINFEKSSIVGEVRIFIHDRSMRGCEYIKVDKINKDSIAEEVVQKLYPLVGKN